MKPCPLLQLSSVLVIERLVPLPLHTGVALQHTLELSFERLNYLLHPLDCLSAFLLFEPRFA